MTTSEKCTQHGHNVQRICLNKQCNDRLMCLLCQHDHDNQFRSILTKTSQSYQRFKNIINQEIDLFLQKQEKSQETKIQLKQIQIIQKFYLSLSKQINQFLKFHKIKTIQTLKSNHSLLIQQINKVRIIGNHYQASPDLFKMFMEVYQGQTIDSFIKSQNQLHAEQAQSMISYIYRNIKKIMDQSSFKSKLIIPDIRSVMIQTLTQKKIFNFQNGISYAQQFRKVDILTRIKNSSSCQFNSIISDALSLKQLIIATSYDKSLRIFDKKLNILAQHQYENILTNVHQIDSQQDLYAIAQSKQLLIQKISTQDNYKPKKIMKLRGHSQRINHIDSYNTRIIGSSSDQGTKIWDLYKSKCQYTFRQNANPTVLTFLPRIKSLAIGYNDHTVKLYSIQTLKGVRKWELDGVPLFSSQQKLNENIFYISGFPSNFAVVDTRLKKLALNHNFKSQAISCFCQSIYEQNLMILGQRGGKARIFQLGKLNEKSIWQAQQGKTNLSKPNGIVRIFEEDQNQYLTVGANDKKLKIWQIKQDNI